jgi:hypothetical protein
VLRVIRIAPVEAATRGSVDDTVARARASSVRAARWIAEHQRPDGLFPSRQPVVESCYKGIWSMVRSGRPSNAMALANAVSGWVGDDGDIRAPREDEGFLTVHYLYANTYLALGAQVLGRFDLSRALYRFVLSRQATCGGFLSQGPGYDSDPCVDTVSTSIAGLTALYLGDLETAKRAGDFLAKVSNDQPEPDRFFYSTASVDGELIVEHRPDEPHVAVDIGDPEQEWYFIGIATMFLPALHEATGDPAHLSLACSYLDYLADSCCPGAFTDASSGKSGVGAAYLHRLTGSAKYREIACAVAEYLMDRQDPAGTWRDEPGEDDPDELEWSDMDMTAEYVLWLEQIAQHLSMRGS